MNFSDSPEDAAYRAEVRAWLESMAAHYDLSHHPSADLGEQLRLGRAFQSEKAAAGFAKPMWPRALGGRDANAVQSVIYLEEQQKFEFPVKFFAIGLGMPIPMIRSYASGADQARYIGPAVRGEEIWCQLFSEPAGGSDLGAVRLRAEPDGKDWVLNGQKIWTSWAHLADFGTILARSDPSLPKHAGLTFFFVNMKTPGIEVRPIHQISGAREFCEVYFNDLRVPDTQRLGAINGGWRVALDTLMEERMTISDPTGGAPALLDTMKLLRDDVSTLGASALEDAALRERIAEWYCLEQGLRNNFSRILTAMSRGSLPGPEAALTKLMLASKLQSYGAAIMDACGPAGAIYPEGAAISRGTDYRMVWFEGAGMRIAGGTDEILRNTLAERVLHLPQDLRTDKNMAFKDLT